MYAYTFQTFYYRRGAQIQITLPKFGLALLFMYKKKLVAVQKQVYYKRSLFRNLLDYKVIAIQNENIL